MSGSAVALTARKVREKALRIAAEALEASVDDLEIVDGMVQVKGSPGAQIDLGAVAVLSNPLRYAFDEAAARATQFAAPADPDKPPVADGEEPGLEGTDYYSPPRSTFANGMHAVVVETDPETAEIKILRYCVVHDCGTIINPMIVEGQVHGGVAQGVGGALYERMEYDESGQLLNASYMDFLMPVRQRGPAHRDRPPRDAVAAQPARGQGRRRGRRDPRLGRDRRRPSRTPRASRSPRCRSRRASCSSCARAHAATAVEAGVMALVSAHSSTARATASRVRLAAEHFADVPCAAAGLRRVRPAAHRGRSLRGPARPAPRHR